MSIKIFKISSSIENRGKRIAKSKRVLNWKFAFEKPNEVNPKSKKVEEHTISLVWSLNSGKRTIYMDGVKQDFDNGVLAVGGFHRKWQWGDCEIELILYNSKSKAKTISAMNNKVAKCILLINGVSFHNLPEHDCSDRPSLKTSSLDTTSTLDSNDINLSVHTPMKEVQKFYQSVPLDIIQEDNCISQNLSLGSSASYSWDGFYNDSLLQQRRQPRFKYASTRDALPLEPSSSFSSASNSSDYLFSKISSFSRTE
ncbi:hypothetical protein CTEN210_06857 [Chaetoceros tenuissimus]|uniref:Uncharacterized protein n=1 Tax=Chaetoceros tenuissimus TaxID=426638 RepID=A0AAD3CQN0_9STRA|nr:hypothetical protein CTEN210_06857 [Chaetoceros tenuissimus]